MWEMILSLLGSGEQGNKATAAGGGFMDLLKNLGTGQNQAAGGLTEGQVGDLNALNQIGIQKKQNRRAGMQQGIGDGTGFSSLMQ